MEAHLIDVGCEQAPELAGRPDEQLLTEYVHTGDSQVFAELTKRHARPLYGYLRKRLGNDHDAEDVLQNTWLNVMRFASDFNPSRTFRIWLYAIATNASFDFLRSKNRTSQKMVRSDNEELLELQLDPHVSSPDHALVVSDIAKIVHDARDGLSVPMQQAFDGMLAGLTYEGMSESMAVPMGTVRSRVHAFRRVMAERLSRHAY